MFFRIKPAGERRYLQIVENTRDGARTVQRVLATLGRVDDLEASGKLDALLRSGARLSETAMLISSLHAGTLDAIVDRAHRRTADLRPTVGTDRLPAGDRAPRRRRDFGFSLERAVFASVLHRLVVSGSDRACDEWLDAYHIDGADALDLHQLYRAMAWLGEELADQSGATRAPRRTKDLIEEALFERRRSLFTDLSVVLFDTTSLMFYGAGGESLGQHGKSKDHRPELHQVVVGVVLDDDGRPICSETWPGNATDVKSLLPVVTRLRERFGITRMCVVADRGMISAETIAELEARGIEYILGARERSDTEVREIVLADSEPMVPLAITRARGAETQLEVEEVVGRRLGTGQQAAPLCGLLQRRGGEARRRGADSHHRQSAREAQAGRQATCRQRRLSPVPRHTARGTFRDRRRTHRRGCPLRWALRAAHQQQAQAPVGCARIPAALAGGGDLPDSKIHPRDAADLPSIRRGDRRAPVLFISGAAVAQGTRRTAGRSRARWNGATSSAISIGSRRSPSIRAPNTSCCAPQAPGCAGSVFKAVGVALPPLLRQPPNAIPPPTTPVTPPRRRGRPRRGATSR